MIDIPMQLRNPDFRFVKIRAQEKGPFEQAWQKTGNYAWNDPIFQAWISNGGNYGVCGGFGKLVIIDADAAKVVEAVCSNLPETFTVKTGRGGHHFYFFCPNLDKPIRMIESVAGDIGDVQWSGKQVVGPGSCHKNGKFYEVLANKPISTVEAEQIRYALRNFINDDSATLADEPMVNDEFSAMKLADMVPLNGLKCKGDEYQGPHPFHGSESGLNFTVNVKKNVWRCFRCDSGGGPLYWLAMKHGILKCHECQKGKLRGALFLKTLAAAGLRQTEQKIEESGHKRFFKELFDENGEKKGEKFMANLLGDEILQKFIIKTNIKSKEIFCYHDGIYAADGAAVIEQEAKRMMEWDINKNMVNEVLFHIAVKTYCQENEFKENQRYLHVKNGIFDMEMRSVIPFTPEIFSLNKIPVTYDPKADCQAFKKFLSEVIQKEDIPRIQEMTGYCLYKGMPFHRAFMLTGSGQNGKSTLLEAIKVLLGEQNVLGIPLQCLGDKFTLINFMGKMANIHPDISSMALRDTGWFKILVGGDSITAEKKHGGFTNFKSYCKQIFSANKIPETRDMTLAFFRRWEIIPFVNEFPSEKADPEMLGKITADAELSGIFNWALEGLKRLLQAKKFSNSQSPDVLEKMYLRMSDSLFAFCEDRTELAPGEWIAKDTFYEDYLTYCRENKLPSKTKELIGRELPMMKPVLSIKPRADEEGKQFHAWSGIKWKKPTETA